jgi:hypothetical protein
MREKFLVYSTKKVSVENKDYGSLQGVTLYPPELDVDGLYGHAVQTITALPDLALKLGTSQKLPCLVELDLQMKGVGTKTMLVAVKGDLIEASSGLFPKFMTALFTGSPMTFSTSSKLEKV